MGSSAITYKRILIATDESDCSKRAVDHGYSLAKLYGSAIALVHVLDATAQTNYIADPLMGQQPVIVSESTDIQVDNAKKLLLEVKERLSDVGEITTFNRLGTPRQEIIATAEEWDADLIIMGTHGRTGFDHFISGSVSEGVIRRSSCPVLVVPDKV